MSDNRSRPSLDAWNLIGIGTYNMVCLLAGMGIGRVFDEWWNTLPALTLTGLAFGIAAGVTGTWFRIRSFLS